MIFKKGDRVQLSDEARRAGIKEYVPMRGNRKERLAKGERVFGTVASNPKQSQTIAIRWDGAPERTYIAQRFVEAI